MDKFAFVVGMMLLGAFGLSACSIMVLTGSGHVVSEERPVGSFNEVSFSGIGDMVVAQGEQEQLKIEAEDNLLPYVRSEVRDGMLRVYYDHSNLQFIHPTRPIRVLVTVKDVSALHLSGSGKMTSEKLTSDQLQLDVSGSGEMKLNTLTANTINAKISGSGSCELNGEAASQKIVISGSGNCDVSGLKSRTVRIDVSGSGKASVRADEALDVNVVGSGAVAYYGHPQVTKTISGSGHVVNQDE